MGGRLAAGWAAVAAALVLAIQAPGRDRASGPAALPAQTGGTHTTSGDDRAVAVGSFLDLPEAAAGIDTGIRLAEKLRLRYGIDTGDRRADRLEAARRANAELLEPLPLSACEISDAARDLGYSLDPADCRDYCGNVERLAIARLRQRALVRFVESPTP